MYLPVYAKKREIKEELTKVSYNPYEEVDISEYMRNKFPNGREND